MDNCDRWDDLGSGGGKKGGKKGGSGGQGKTAAGVGQESAGGGGAWRHKRYLWHSDRKKRLRR